MEDNFITTLAFTDTVDWRASNNNPTQNNVNGVGTTETVSEVINSSRVYNAYNTSALSLPYIDTVLHIYRVSPTISISSESTVNVRIQLQPTQLIDSYAVLDNNTVDVTGQTVVIQDSTTATALWTYPALSGGAGVVSGYYVSMYKDAECTQPVGVERTVGASGTYAQSSITYNTADLEIGVMNYIKITPYYTKPDNTGTLRGTLSFTSAFVKPISRLDTPVIEYPKNNTTWLNNKFRVLFKLPADTDFDDIGVTEANYTYRDIEVKVTPLGNNPIIYKYTDNTFNNCFSCNDLKEYRKEVAINPSIYSNLPNVSSYTIQVRVRKNYYVDDLTEEYSWSAWSNEVTINVSSITELVLNRGDIVRASHYTTPRDKSVQLLEAYPFIALPQNNQSKQAGDIILYNNYQAIYDTIKAIQLGVNNYCTYDRLAVKYNTIIDAFDLEPAKQEIVTADKEPLNINGRNYINILIQEMNKLV